MDVFKKFLGKKIKELRKLRGFSSQGDLAEAIGTDQNTVSRWESGQNWPSKELLEKLLVELNVSEEALVSLEPEATVTDLTAVIRSQEERLKALEHLQDLIPADIRERLAELSSDDWESFRGMMGWESVTNSSEKKTDVSS